MYYQIKLLWLLLILAFNQLPLVSQIRPRCKTDELSKFFSNNKIEARKNSTEEAIREFINTKYKDDKNPKIQNHTTYVIPIVVHVVWHYDEENVPDARVISNINSLNEDFRRMPQTLGFNTNPVGADTRIEFRLAEIDPLGNPTNGIVHTYTTNNSDLYESSDTRFTLYNDHVKKPTYGGVAPWDVSEYLNIWVCRIWDETDDGWIDDGTLGYAYQPWWGYPYIQGIVVNYNYFGDNINTLPDWHLGRTLTHEAGHFFGLYHTSEQYCYNNNCQTDGDKCCDTPPVDGGSAGCQIGRQSCGVPTQIENYMDITTDACLNLFTVDQSDRMDATLAGVRVNLPNPTMSTDFRVFGVHEGNYNYNETTDIVALGTGQYDDMIIPSGNTVSMRSRTGVIFQDGFEALYGSDMRAFVDNGLPAFGRKPDHFERISNQYETDDSGDSQMISIIPNPATDEIQILGTITAPVELFSSVGLSVMTVEKGVRKVDVSQLTSGVYYARIPTVTGVVVKSFMIIR